MIRYIIKRLLQLIPILFAASVLIFFLVRLAPSDPIASMTEGRRISEETREALEKQYYLDRSYPEQYFIWITHAPSGGSGRQFPVPSVGNVTDRGPASNNIAACHYERHFVHYYRCTCRSFQRGENEHGPGSDAFYIDADLCGVAGVFDRYRADDRFCPEFEFVPNFWDGL